MQRIYQAMKIPVLCIPFMQSDIDFEIFMLRQGLVTRQTSSIEESILISHDNHTNLRMMI